jgi:homoserine O-succinyltransferase/O-acetyltransferase
MLTIGLVNNMPPAAIQSTERQFCDILSAAGPDISFRIRWFRLLPAKPASYEPLEDLWRSSLDGVIVTGTEPRAASLRDEPIWQALTKTVDWASERTSSAIFSCLAAHGAALHRDGIERRLHNEKIFGVFDSIKVADHPLLFGTPNRWRVPHSRWNDLPEDELVARGYTILAKSRDAGVDLFAKRAARSLFLFIQTHPEYSAHTLLREFRRDVARFNNGQQERYPTIPRNYFNERQVAELEASHNEAVEARQTIQEQILQQTEMSESWRPFSVQLYRNWLLYLQAYAVSGQAA